MMKLDSRSAALLLLIVFMFGFWSIFQIYRPSDELLLSSRLVDFQIESSQLHFSSRLPLFFYAGSVFTLSATCIYLLLRPGIASSGPDRSADMPVPVVVLPFVIPFLIGEYTYSFSIGFVVTSLILFLAIKFNYLNTLNKKPLYLIFIFIAIIYLIFFFAFPFATPLVARNGARLATFESHYAMTVLPGLDWVCCKETGMIERSNYGASMFMLTALAHKITAALGMQDGTLVLPVRIYQVIAAFLVALTVFILNRKHFLLLSAVAIIAAPSLNTIGEAVYYPNQSGIRYVPFLLGILALALEARRQNPRTLVLSVISALTIIASPEIGFAVFCGYSVFLILSKYQPGRPYSTTIKEFLLFAAATILIFKVVYDIAIKGIYKNVSTDIFSLVEIFASGYGGLVSKPSVFASLAAFFAAAAIIRGVLRARSGTLSRVDAFQSGIAMMMLVWIAYYANRMDEWNLWFNAVLILLMFAPRVDLSVLRILSRRFQFAKIYVALALSMTGGLLFWSAEIAFFDSLNYHRLLNASCPDEPEQVKGFCITSPDGPEILEKMAFLDGLDEKQDYLAISLLPTQVRLMGFNEGVPWYEPFGEIPRSRELEAATAWIEANGPQYLLTDDPALTVATQMVYRMEHLQRLVDGLTSYRSTKTVSGWVLYERVPDPVSPEIPQ